MKCFFLNCGLPPMLACECKSKRTLMCQFHRSNHFESLPDCKHGLIHLTDAEEYSEKLLKKKQITGFAGLNIKSESDADFYTLKNKLAEVKINIKATKKTIIAQTEEAISEIQSYSNYLIALIKEIEMKHQKLSKSLNEAFKDTQNLKNSDIWNQKDFKISQLRFKVEKINTKNALSTILAELEGNKEINLSMPKSFHMHAPNETSNIYMIKPDTKKLVSLDPSTHLVTSCELKLPSALNGCSLCYADGNLFGYGNCVNKNYLGSAFFITKQGKIKILKEGIPSIYSGSIYKKGFVYAFGGWDGNLLANTRRFNIKSNKWQDLADLPSAGSLYCCETIKNKILISGSSHSRLYIYDLNSNSYCRSSLKLCQGRKKIICKYKKYAYIIEAEGDIYESSPGNVFEWKILSASNIQNRGMFIYKSYNKSTVYFSIDNKIFRFDLKTKALQKEYELEK